MKRFVKDLKEKDHVQSIFMVVEKNSGADRNGKPILSVTLSDSSGQINGRMFEKVGDVVKSFEVGDPVWVKGFVQLFQNRRQVIVHEIRKAVENEFQMTDLIADLGGDPKDHLASLEKIVRDLENAPIRELLTRTMSDGKVRELLLKAPAAKTIHHAYRGGLIEHIHSIAQVLLGLSVHYTFLDKSLLVFGAIFHDLGKIFELDVSDGIRYTTSGRLVGHMAIACDLIEKFSDGIAGMDQDLKDILKHIVLSHHGKIEYGSPKLPMLPEAIVVSMIDDFDSKLNTLFHFLKSETAQVPPDEKWTHYHPGFERYFYLDFFRRKLGGEPIS